MEKLKYSFITVQMYWLPNCIGQGTGNAARWVFTTAGRIVAETKACTAVVDSRLSRLRRKAYRPHRGNVRQGGNGLRVNGSVRIHHPVFNVVTNIRDDVPHAVLVKGDRTAYRH